jgi:hypothetical protein
MHDMSCEFHLGELEFVRYGLHLQCRVSGSSRGSMHFLERMHSREHIVGGGVRALFLRNLQSRNRRRSLHRLRGRTKGESGCDCVHGLCRNCGCDVLRFVCRWRLDNRRRFWHNHRWTEFVWK